jgi:TatD DNase family protein
MWFDAHCHLNLPGFGAEPRAVWETARAGGVRDVFVPGTDPDEWSTSNLPGLPGVRTGVGLHPFTLEQRGWEPTSSRVAAALTDVAAQAEHGHHVAVGECGWDKPLAVRCPMWSLDQQTNVVEAHLALAVELQLPIVLHVVQSHGLALDVLRKYRLPKGGIIHCFSGHAELVPLYGRLGFVLGYGTQLLRSNPTKALAALRATPRQSIVLETDAPFRESAFPGVPNSPLGVVNVARIISTALDVSLEQLAVATADNARRVFDG